MRTPGRLSRRDALGLLPLCPALVAAAGSKSLHARKYRIHATVQLLGAPLFHRESVGAAALLIERCRSRDALAIQFAAGSWPDRAHGLNRFGMTREICSPSRSEWLSFMTSSPENSLRHARHSLFSSSGKSPLRLTASRGEISSSVRAWGQARLELAGNPLWLETPRLAGTLSSRVPLLPLELDSPIPPFLCAAFAAFSSVQPDPVLPFLHNGKRYTLYPSIAYESTGAAKLSASIRNEAGKTTASFRAWKNTHSDSALPTRFEFQPRDFLKLTFAEDASVETPLFPTLIAGDAE
jgi:hypothetical protein